MWDKEDGKPVDQTRLTDRIRTATAEIVMCWASRSMMPLGRVQLNGSLR